MTKEKCLDGKTHFVESFPINRSVISDFSDSDKFRFLRLQLSALGNPPNTPVSLTSSMFPSGDRLFLTRNTRTQALAGYAVANCNVSSQQPTLGRISYLGADYEERGSYSGIGRMLMEHIDGYFHQEGVEVARVRSLRSAQGFYEKQGFAVDEARYNSEHSVEMMKRLQDI